jgi:hypothetical protein
MGNQEQISLTGKKAFKIKAGSDAFRSWKDKFAEMEQLRRQVYEDMLGIGAEKKQKEEAEKLQKNN